MVPAPDVCRAGDARPAGDCGPHPRRYFTPATALYAPPAGLWHGKRAAGAPKRGMSRVMCKMREGNGDGAAAEPRHISDTAAPPKDYRTVGNLPRQQFTVVT